MWRHLILALQCNLIIDAIFSLVIHAKITRTNNQLRWKKVNHLICHNFQSYSSYILHFFSRYLDDLTSLNLANLQSQYICDPTMWKSYIGRIWQIFVLMKKQTWKGNKITIKCCRFPDQTMSMIILLMSKVANTKKVVALFSQLGNHSYRSVNYFRRKFMNARLPVLV